MRNDRAKSTSQEKGSYLNPQLEAVWQAMRDGAWRGLEEIAALAECPPASASARLRDLRKAEFGGWDVERAYAGNRRWRYRVCEKAAQGVMVETLETTADAVGDGR